MKIEYFVVTHLEGANYRNSDKYRHLVLMLLFLVIPFSSSVTVPGKTQETNSFENLDSTGLESDNSLGHHASQNQLGERNCPGSMEMCSETSGLTASQEIKISPERISLDIDNSFVPPRSSKHDDDDIISKSTWVMDDNWLPWSSKENWLEWSRTPVATKDNSVDNEEIDLNGNKQPANDDRTLNSSVVDGARLARTSSDKDRHDVASSGSIVLEISSNKFGTLSICCLAFAKILLQMVFCNTMI